MCCRMRQILWLWCLDDSSLWSTARWFSMIFKVKKTATLGDVEVILHWSHFIYGAFSFVFLQLRLLRLSLQFMLMDIFSQVVCFISIILLITRFWWLWGLHFSIRIFSFLLISCLDCMLWKILLLKWVLQQKLLYCGFRWLRLLMIFKLVEKLVI